MSVSAPEAALPPEETLQALHAIYAWTKLLQAVTLDEAERVRALEVIERNGQLLLGRLGSAS